MRVTQSSVRWLAACIVVAASCKNDSLEPDGGSVASVVITPPTATVAVGANVSLTAEALDASGKALTGVKIVWATADSKIATVSGSGGVSGVAAGLLATVRLGVAFAVLRVAAFCPGLSFSRLAALATAYLSLATGTVFGVLRLIFVLRAGIALAFSGAVRSRHVAMRNGCSCAVCPSSRCCWYFFCCCGTI